MHSYFRIFLVALCLAQGACALDADKPAGAPAFDPAALDASPRDRTIDSPPWCEVNHGTLTRLRPYQIWTLEGPLCRDGFVDLASRAGDDMYLLVFARRDGGSWELVAQNDDHYEGTLNAGVEMAFEPGVEYAVVATTWQFATWGVGARVPDYDLQLHCRDSVGACYDPTRLCGSRGLEPCGEGFYCDFPDDGCGADDVPGFCTPIPELCPTFYAPVCGCDGVSYSSGCWAAMRAGVDYAYLGDCL